MDDFELEIKKDFLEECIDLLSEAESAFLELDSNRGDPELMNEIFRLAHNLKGSSKAVGFDQLGELTHIAENLILKLKEGALEVSDSIVSVLLEFNDKVNEMIQGLNDDLEATFNIDDTVKKLVHITDGEEEAEVKTSPDTSEGSEEEGYSSASAIEEVSAVDESTVQDFFHNGSAGTGKKLGPESDILIGSDEDIGLVNQAALESLKEIGFEASLESNASAAAPEVVFEGSSKTSKERIEKPLKQKAGSKGNSQEDESIRVKLVRIDKLNDIIGELVILQTVLNQRRFQYIKDDLSNKTLGLMGKLFKETQELTMSLRMLPLKNTFQKMSRIVRDTSIALDKKVKLHSLGEDTEVDKTVLERLSDPLVHIIRNAVDHGLESAEERIGMNKSAEGNVELMAFHEGSNLVIQITDDGKGIDPKIIERKAIAKGVIRSNSRMSDHEIIQLVFHPGFSTKEQVTEVSGRGVGMDVVKTNIEGLGGEVKIMSKVGEGSSVKIILPLTLAIIDGIVITSRHDKYVIPLSQVFELTNVSKEKIEEFSGGMKLITLRGEVIPLFYINEKLGQKINNNEKQIVIVVRGLNYAFGVVVDDILNQQQIVIKQIGEDIRDKNGIMGSAIMGDGKPAFILDIFELFKNDLKKSRGYEKLKDDYKLAA